MRLVVHRHPGRGVPIVALHGFTGSGEDFAPLFGSRPWLAPDLPGHGRSPDPPSYDLACVLDALAAVTPDRFTLLGYSMGGRIALHAALAWPERVDRLVLVGATAGIAADGDRAARRASDAALAQRILQGGVAAFADHWESVPIIASQRAIAPAYRVPMRARRRRNRATGLARSLSFLGQGTLPSVWHRLGDVATPTLLVTGSRDPRYGAVAAEMAARMPRAAHVVVPGVGHCAHLEAPERVRPLVEES